MIGKIKYAKINRQKRRKNPRLDYFDYSEPRSYFFTICSFSNKLIFKDPAIRATINKCCINIPSSYPLIRLDEFVIMPNHVHGILWIKESGIINKKRPILATVIGSLKSAITKKLHEQSLIEGKVWQRNYFERVIRNDEALNAIRKYIRENPLKWKLDKENLQDAYRRGVRHA